MSATIQNNSTKKISNIHSMTAFARTQSQGKWGSLICEMRSINHRYLEISLHFPDVLHALEMPVREIIRKYIKRGKIECSLRYQVSPNLADSLFSINMVLAKELAHASEKISGLFTFGKLKCFKSSK